MSKYIDAEVLKNNIHKCEWVHDRKSVEKFVDKLPAADVEPRWIPVTERLPEERGTYLVTVNDGGIRVAIAQWWYDVDNGGEWYFVYDDYYVEDIVAWMPLPDPYKEGEQNE